MNANVTVHTPPPIGGDDGPREETPTLTLVLDAIRDLHEAGEEPTRDRIAKMTGLKLVTVDDRIKVLRGEGLITPVKQCYRPMHVHGPARVVSVSALPDGMLRVDVGEQGLLMTPHEQRALAQLLAGKSVEATGLERLPELQTQLVKLAHENRDLARQVRVLVAAAQEDPRQASLIGITSA